MWLILALLINIKIDTLVYNVWKIKAKHKVIHMESIIHNSDQLILDNWLFKKQHQKHQTYRMHIFSTLFKKKNNLNRVWINLKNLFKPLIFLCLSALNSKDFQHLKVPGKAKCTSTTVQDELIEALVNVYRQNFHRNYEAV